MKTNKWIMWVILFTSLFGIANKGVSVIAFILSIVILTKYVLVDKKSVNDRVDRTYVEHPNQISNRELRKNERIKKKEEKARVKEQIKQQEEQHSIQRSYDYFDVDFIDGGVTKSSAAPFYKKIRTDTEKVIDVVKAKVTKNVKNYKRRGYHYETAEKGLLILTTENVYFITTQNGFAKTTYPIKNINGMTTGMAYLTITYSKSKYIYNIEGYKRSDLFMKNYMQHFYG
ncbi:hypothetical protein [Staphylococcus chromogenes]|uniref:hypothetical protein n=1 Tax=Staphylococcus chromogenes TaxID=46126 RepID=UPI000D1AB4C2|nr:hypothetical protein [Staphylococcus chromogenes]PTG21244.1 hypothetical protein BU637_04990 [Staphylococcus chromogenes]PTG64852.1 hypothetical protein BU674_06765 [Staphylococcus chromogenes]